jgi:asparagine synthase (glutamine-hydrolysing)
VIRQILGGIRLNNSAKFKEFTNSELFEEKTYHQLVRKPEYFLVSSTDNIYYSKFHKVFVAAIPQITGCLDSEIQIDNDNICESIFNLYSKHGNDFAKFINGYFVIVIWDENKNQLLLIQDKFPGIKTLYWVIENDVLYFSNYIKPLITLLPEKKLINNKGLYQFLKYSYITAPETIFLHIKQFLPGELIKIQDGNFSKYIYDKWECPSQKIANEPQALENYKSVLKESIERYKSLDPSFGFTLSGGYDSSVNVALGQENEKTSTTIGIGAEKFNTDAHYARKVSDLFNTNHKEYLFDGSEINDLPQIVWHMENPYYEPGLMLTYFLLSIAGNNFKNLIGGEAADQIFGAATSFSYSWYRSQKRFPLMFNLGQRSIRFITRNYITKNSPFWSKVENKLIGKYNVNNWSGVYGFRDSDILSGLRIKFDFEEKYDLYNIPNDLEQLFDYCTINITKDYALSGILAIYGRIGDIFDVQSYSPYLDKEVLNLVLSLDHSLRTPLLDSKKGFFGSKYLQVQLANQLIPAEIFNRPKQGGAINPYIHFQDLQRQEGIKKKLLNSYFINNLFYRSFIENLFVNIKSNATKILQLLTLDIWNSTFMLNTGLIKPDFSLDEYLQN